MTSALGGIFARVNRVIISIEDLGVQHVFGGLLRVPASISPWLKRLSACLRRRHGPLMIYDTHPPVWCRARILLLFVLIGTGQHIRIP